MIFQIKEREKFITSSNTHSPSIIYFNNQTNSFFAFVMEDDVRCVIDDGSKRSCGDYILNLPVPQTQDDCIVNLVYLYDFTNVGTICDEVSVFSVEMDGESSKVFTPDLTPEERNFCPGNQLTIPDPVPGYDICSLAGREVTFDIDLNGLPGRGSSGKYQHCSNLCSGQ